jgi:hypothetical protein
MCIVISSVSDHGHHLFVHVRHITDVKRATCSDHVSPTQVGESIFTRIWLFGVMEGDTSLLKNYYQISAAVMNFVLK